MNFTWKIPIADRKKTGIDIVIDCFFIQHDQINVIDADLVNRLTLLNQRRDDAINPF